MRLTLPLVAGLLALTVLPAEAGPRPRCDVPTQDGVHVKFHLSYGERDYETQQLFDMMELRKQGINPRSVRRTGDGCIEAFVPNGDGTFNNEYYTPDTFELVFD